MLDFPWKLYVLFRTANDKRMITMRCSYSGLLKSCASFNWPTTILRMSQVFLAIFKTVADLTCKRLLYYHSIAVLRLLWCLRFRQLFSCDWSPIWRQKIVRLMLTRSVLTYFNQLNHKSEGGRIKQQCLNCFHTVFSQYKYITH